MPCEQITYPTMKASTLPRFSISPYFAAYDPAKPVPVNTKTVEQLLSDAGSFGVYQILVFLTLGLLAVVPSMVSFSYNFNLATPPHRCRLFPNDTYWATTDAHRTLVNNSIPVTTNYYDSCCKMLDNSSALIACPNGWVFDMDLYGVTLSTELLLICEKLHVKALTQNIYSAGTAGSIITGLLADRWGRRKTIYLLVILLFVSLNAMQLSLYSNSYKFIAFTICRFFQGFSVTFHSVILVLLLELTGPSRRVLAANTLAYSFALGQIILPIVSQYLKNYLMSYWALTVYVLPFLFVYILIPESPRWLVQQGRVREARKVFERIFRINRRSIHDRIEMFYSRLPLEAINARQEEQKRPTYFKVLKRLCRSKSMRKRCLLLMAVWAVASSVYLGVSAALPTLSSWPHAVFVAGAVCEMVGLGVCHCLASRVERRRLLVVFFVINALASALIAFTPDTDPWVSVSFALLGKLTASSCQLLIVVYTTETYPTALRSSGVGFTACIARLVSMLVPQVSATQHSVWFSLPYIVYALASCLGALAASQLPLIHSPCKLPETVHEIEKQDAQAALDALPAEPPPASILSQRRPSSALIRELGVVKPTPPLPIPIINRSIPRRHSTFVGLLQSPKTTVFSPMPTISDLNEDEEENKTTEHAPPSMITRISSLPTRLFAVR